MTEQPPPSASDEALSLATRIRDRYHAPGNEHVLELSDAALEIDRFAERVCEQRVSAARRRWVREDAKAMRPFEEEAAAVLAECELGYEGDEPHKIDVIARALRQRVSAETERCVQIAFEVADEDFIQSGSADPKLAREIWASACGRTMDRIRAPAERHAPPQPIEIHTCPKCGAQAAAFNCSEPGCPVNGGAAYPQQQDLPRRIGVEQPTQDKPK